MPCPYLYYPVDVQHILAIVDSCTSSSWQRRDRDRMGKRRRLARALDLEIHILFRESENDGGGTETSSSRRVRRSAV